MTGVLAAGDLGTLFTALREGGWRVIGPTVRDDAIVYAELAGPDDLPTGWTDDQAPGRYRLRRRGDGARFGYAVGPHAWKAELFPAREVLTRTRVDGDGVPTTETTAAPARPTAFLGVRACELAAIGIQDRVFTGGPHADPRYAARRAEALIVAVSCGDPADTCFCTSMGTGPRVRSGADLVLTELVDRGAYHVEAQSPRGEVVAARLPLRPAGPADDADVDAVESRATARIHRRVRTESLPGRLFGNLDHPRWAEVASRCLSCGNCALVCPTCFCSDVHEESALDAAPGVSQRVRTWDTCFSVGHGTIHGAVFRARTEDRWRQWLTHKFGSWHAQFGTSGCVGCGRCATWCPVGIDVTEELAVLGEGDPVETPVWSPPPAPSPADPLLPVTGTVVERRRELSDVVTLRIRAPGVPVAGPGQFHQLGLPGLGEVPISVSGEGPDHVHTVRAVGAVTDALAALEPGAPVQLRGPYGAGWPLAALRGRPVVVVAGGLGLAPLRTAIRALLADREGFPEGTPPRPPHELARATRRGGVPDGNPLSREGFPEGTPPRPPHELARATRRGGVPDGNPSSREGYPFVAVLVGARHPDALLYADELRAWASAGARVEVTVDRASPGWTGHVGVVTRLLRGDTVPAGSAALVCGPEPMMRFTVLELLRRGVGAGDVWLSMERHMKCAVGLCGRCQYGHHLVCRDGPVFRASDLRLDGSDQGVLGQLGF